MASPSVTYDFSKIGSHVPPFQVYQDFQDIVDGLNSTTSGWDVSVLSLTTPTLTVSSSLILSYLTANTVLQANSSKAVASIANGSGNQVLGMNSGGTDQEYKTIQGTANEIDVGHTANAVTIGIVNPLSTGKGGTGNDWSAATQYSVPYFLSAGALGLITPAASSLLGSSALNVPSWVTDIPTAITIGSAYIYRVGGTDVAVTDGGTGLSTLGAADTLLCVDDAGTAFNYRALAVGTSGTDFNLAATDAGGFVFNLPDAGASARGAMTTGAQTLAGAKTFSTSIASPGVLSLTGNVIHLIDGTWRIRSNAATRYRSDYAISGTAAFLNVYDDTGGVYLPFYLDATEWHFRSSAGATGVDIDASANMTVDGTLTVVGMGAGAGTYPVKWVSGGLLTYDSSSVRFKQDVRDYALADKVIDALVVRQFEYNDKTINPGQWDYGMIAEEVMVIAPELVAYDPDGKPGTVRYDRLGVLAVQEIQRLRRRVAALEGKKA